MEENDPEPLETAAQPAAEIGREDLLMLLLSAPERVADLVAGLDETGLRYRHGPAFPTVREVIAHTANAGVQLDHLITAVALETGPAPPLRSLLEADTPDESGPVQDVLADWQRVRRRGIDLLRGLRPERWEAVLDDPQRGAVTIEEALRLVLRHELGHVAQLRNLTALVPESAPIAQTANESDHA